MRKSEKLRGSNYLGSGLRGSGAWVLSVMMKPSKNFNPGG
jgi:hypothetical protein